jgi:hypothetical protein
MDLVPHERRNCNDVLDLFYGRLRSFTFWEPNSIAELTVRDDIGSFWPEFWITRMGVLALNDICWTVQFTYDDPAHTITARTLGDHPLVGVRRWSVKKLGSAAECVLQVATEAYQKPRNLALLLSTPMAYEDQATIWTEYLRNVPDFAEGTGCLKDIRHYEPLSENARSFINPWLE